MRKLLLALLLFPTLALAVFPSVDNRVTSQETVATTSHDITYFATVDPDDLIVVAFSCFSDNCDASTPSGFTLVDNNTIPTNLNDWYIFAKKAAGTEDSTTLTITSTNSERSATVMYRISAWEADTVANGFECGTVKNGASSAPTPNSFGPTWGAGDNLALTILFAANDDATVSANPSGYSGASNIFGGGTNAGGTTAIADKTFTSASEAPGSWSLSTSQSVSMVTCAVEEGAAGPTFTSNPVLNSCSSTGCTFDYTADAASDTLYAMFTDTAASAPTCDAIEALTGNHGDANEATTGASDSITVPADVDTPRFPIYDAHFCIEDSGGLDSAVVTVSDVTLDDQTNSHYIQLDAVTGTLAADFNTAVDPDIVAGDWLNVPDDLTPGIKGEHDGSGNAATLTDSSKSWTVDALIAKTITNDTDGSSCEITDNDATTVTCTLSGGTDNDWDVDDAYTIPIAYDGTHDGSGNAATLTDTDQAWTTNALVDLEVMNTTDGSQCEITANTATTITCTLAGGTDNDWDVSDAYEIGLVDHDAEIVYSDGGDGAQQRAYDIEVYDVSAGDWHASDIDFIANNNAPVCGENDLIVYSEDEAISTFDLDNICSDQDYQDQSTYTVTSGTLPTGLSLNGSTGEITGTPTIEDETGAAITFTATDIAAATASVDYTFYIVNTVTLPTLDDSDLDAATTDMQNAFPWRVEDLGLTATFSCGAEAVNQVLSQDPAASTEVTAYDEITVVVSTGSACATGLPLSGDWEPWYDITLLPEFTTIKIQECDGDAVWAKWRQGTSVTPRGSANCVVQESLIRQEADGNAVWARWAPNTTIRNSALLQIDIRAALTADFVVN